MDTSDQVPGRKKISTRPVPTPDQVQGRKESKFKAQTDEKENDRQIKALKDRVEVLENHLKSRSSSDADCVKCATLEKALHQSTQYIDRLTAELETVKKQSAQEMDRLKVALETANLSCSAAAKAPDSNPNIADLSDPYRPKVIAERFSLLYDDQWTDAMESLEKFGTNEERNIKILLDFLITIYSHCKESSDNQISRIEEDLFLPPMGVVSPSTERQTRSHSVPKVKGEKMPEVPAELKKGIKEYRKIVAEKVVPVIEKEVLAKLRRLEEFGDKVVDVCLPYIKKGVELCWRMCVQDPPVVLDWGTQEGAFNVDLYRAYTKFGSQMEFVVWPIVYLHEGGPVLLKGIAQGRD